MFVASGVFTPRLNQLWPPLAKKIFFYSKKIDKLGLAHPSLCER